jgi:hypothetical protein
MGATAPPRPVIVARRKPTPEEAMRLHAEHEARLEVRSWFTGDRYEWEPWLPLRRLRVRL